MEQVSHCLLSGPLQADRVGGVQFWLCRGCGEASKQTSSQHYSFSPLQTTAGQGQPGTAAEQMSQGRCQAGLCSWDSWTTGVSHRSRNVFAKCNHHDISP